MRALALAAMAAVGMMGAGEAATLNGREVDENRLVLLFDDNDFAIWGEDGLFVNVGGKWGVVDHPLEFPWDQSIDNFSFSEFYDGPPGYFYYVSVRSAPVQELDQGPFGVVFFTTPGGPTLAFEGIEGYFFAPVPVPAAAPLLLTGAAALWGIRRREKRA